MSLAEGRQAAILAGMTALAMCGESVVDAAAGALPTWAYLGGVLALAAGGSALLCRWL